MNRRITLLIVLFIQFLFGQSLIKLDGYVRDTGGSPLADVRLGIIGGAGVYSDSRGYFYFENLFAGSYRLSVEKIGYEKQVHEVVIGKDNRLTLALVLRGKILTGPQIRVDGTTLRPAGALELGAEQIRRSPATNVGELIRQLPTVRIVIDAGGAQHISLRGSALNQVLVLLDGVALNDPLSGMVDLARIPTGNIVHIRLLKGNQSARYGNGAIGGVLLITTRQASMDGTRFALLTGSFGLLNFQAESGFSSGAFYLNLGGEKTSTDGDFPYRYQLADGSPQAAKRLNAGFRDLSLHGDMGYTHGSNRFHVFVRWQESHRGLPGQVFGLTPYASATNRRQIIGAVHTYAKAKWFNRLNLEYDENSTRYNNFPPAGAPLKYRSAPAYDNRYRIQTLQVTDRATLSFWEKQVATVRVEFRKDDFSDTNYLPGYQNGGVAWSQNSNTALILQNDWRLPNPGFLQSLQIEHALRLDYYDISGVKQNIKRLQFSPDITISTQILKQASTRLWIRYGQGFRMPTFADLFYQDFRVKGNAALLPETSHSLEGGLETNLKFWGELNLSGTYFDNKIDNLILWQLGSFSTWQPFNTNARIRGYEFGFNWRFWHDHLILMGDDNILSPVNKSGERTTDGKDLTYRPRRSGKLGIALHIGGFQLTWQQRREGTRFITASNTVALPSYAVQDITIDFKWSLPEKVVIHFKAAVYNLAGHRYEISEHAPVPGRNGRIGMDVRF